MTVMDLWCKFRGQQGGTIHATIREFRELPIHEKDRFCGILVDNLQEISDLHHVQDLMRLRLSSALSSASNTRG